MRETRKRHFDAGIHFFCCVNVQMQPFIALVFDLKLAEWIAECTRHDCLVGYQKHGQVGQRLIRISPVGNLADQRDFGRSQLVLQPQIQIIMLCFIQRVPGELVP